MAISGVNNPVCSFRGSNSDENTKGVKDVSSKITEVTKEMNETVDAASEGMDAIAKGAGTLGTSAIGLWTIAKKPIAGVYEFFTDIVMENGKPVIQDVFDKQGNKKINKETGEVITKVLRKANWKKLGIAGGVIAAGLAGLAIFSKIKNNKNAKVEEQQQVNNNNSDNSDKEEV